jgi:hypothetical protein
MPMAMAPEVGGVLGGEVGEAGFGFGAVEEGGEVGIGGGFGFMPLLLIGGAVLAIILALMLLKKKK